MFKFIPAPIALLSLTAMIQTADSPGTSTWAQFSAFTYDGKVAISPKEGEHLNPTTNSVPQNVNQ